MELYATKSVHRATENVRTRTVSNLTHSNSTSTTIGTSTPIGKFLQHRNFSTIRNLGEFFDAAGIYFQGNPVSSYFRISENFA